MKIKCPQSESLPILHFSFSLYSKNGEGRIVVPLNSNAIDILASLPWKKPTHKLFYRISGDRVSMAFGRACKKAGIEDFRFHDLRHTTGSWLAMSGKDIYTIAKILGHKDLRMSARYSHLSAQYLSDAVRGLDRVFEEREQVSETVSPQSIPAAIALIEEQSVNN